MKHEGSGELETPGLAVTESGFVELFPELGDGNDLGIVEYFPPTPAAVDLTDTGEPGAA